MKVVINSTPIISLAIIDKIDLLKSLFDQIIIPQAVYDEIVIRGKNKPGSRVFEKTDWYDIKEIINQNTKDSIMLHLDEGEAEVITIAKENSIETVIIDEFAGRNYASLLGLNVMGTLGILLAAKKLGLIEEIRPLMDLLIKKNRYINSSLYEFFLEKSGESKD